MSSIYDRVLITGGGGMLARSLAQTLCARAIEPEICDRATLDITNLKHVHELFMRGPSVVLNCAAYTKVDLAEQEPEQAYAINGYAIGELANGCRLGSAKLVHFSTDFVFDGRSRKPYRPDDSINPLGEYGRSKLSGEEAALSHARADILIIRTAWLYGLGGPNFVQTMLNLARAGKPIRVVDDQIGAPTFTHDLAEATLNLIDHDAKGIWHVTNAGKTSWFGFAQAIFEEFNLKADLQPISSAEWKKLKPDSATRPAYSVLDIEPYAKLTGTPMRHWREALRDYRRALEAGDSGGGWRVPDVSSP